MAHDIQHKHNAAIRDYSAIKARIRTSFKFAYFG